VKWCSCQDQQGSYAANSAEKSLAKRGVSILFGHLHRRQTLYHWNASLELEQQAHVLGTMSLTRSNRYPGFAVCDDWTQGFSTCQVFPDGSWVVDHALWNGECLTWRDQQF
jgi:hypothetical protein